VPEPPRWGLARLVKCDALSYARRGIRINAIAPGSTLPSELDRWTADAEVRENVAGQAPMNYTAHADDMGREGAGRLASKLASRHAVPGGAAGKGDRRGTSAGRSPRLPAQRTDPR